MTIFIVAGIFSSLVWQLLNRAGSPQNSDRKYQSQSSGRTETRASYRENSNLREEANFKTTRTRLSDSVQANKAPVSDWEERKSEDWEQTNRPSFTKTPEIPRQSPKRKPDDVNYSYNSKKDVQFKENSNSESSKPPVSKKTEEIYDANYRTLNNVPPPSVPEEPEDEDADWI